MAVEDEVAEVEQQVLTVRLDLLEPAPVDSLEAGRTRPTATRSDLQLLPNNRRFEPPRRAQDRVALCHASMHS
jgi:hypothetical protein